MLRSRSVFVEIRRVRVRMSVRRGCSQGGVLSPILCNMVTNSLLNWLGSCNCFVQDIVDVVVIFISGKFFSTICALNCVQNWCGERGLNINADKISISQKEGIERVFFAPKL
jgi:hypothetical protein